MNPFIGVVFALWCALGIPTVYFGVAFRNFGTEKWLSGTCHVNGLIPIRDDYPICRSLFDISILNHPSPAVACSSVNAHQPFGGSSDSVCANIDGRPWLDGPLLPAAWKCALGPQYQTALQWNQSTHACVYQCQDGTCVAMLDTLAVFIDWNGYTVLATVSYSVVVYATMAVVWQMTQHVHDRINLFAVCANVVNGLVVAFSLAWSSSPTFLILLFWFLGTFFAICMFAIFKQGFFLIVHQCTCWGLAIYLATLTHQDPIYLAATLHYFMYGFWWLYVSMTFQLMPTSDGFTPLPH